MSNSKLISLDGMRGIAAIFVFIRHTGDYWGDFSFFHSYLAVDIFFILSGFVIAHAYEKRFESNTLTSFSFIKIRLIRLYPMYLLGLLLGLILVNTKLSLGINIFSLNEDHLLSIILLSLLFLPSNVGPGQILFPLNGASWSLFYELAVNCLYGLIRKFLTIPVLLAVLIITSLILAYSGYKVGGLDIGVMGGIKTIFAANARALFGIFYGLILHKLYCQGYRIKAPISLQVIPMILMSAIFMTPNMGNLNWLFDIIALTVILPLCVFWSASVDCVKTLNKPYIFLGMISYPLYILHGPISGFFDIYIKDTITQYQPFSGIIFTLFMLAICAIAVRLIDEPLRAKLSQIFVKKPQKIASGT